MGKGTDTEPTLRDPLQVEPILLPASAPAGGSLFQAKVVEVTLTPHDNADTLSLAHVLGWTCVVRTADFVTTNIGLYVPIDAIVPEPLLASWNLSGKLAGAEHNRVKTIRLRGKLSQGLLIPLDPALYRVGQDLTEELGITKYDPPAPETMHGRAKVWPSGLQRYDVERIENFPNILQYGELVVATEKLEGTNAAFDLRLKGDAYDFSTCSRGIAFGLDAEENRDNLYCKIAKEFSLPERLQSLAAEPPAALTTWLSLHAQTGIRSLTLRGEVVGGKVQGNIYKLPRLAFRAFDIYVNDVALDYPLFVQLANLLEVPTVPELYQGAFPENWRAISYGQTQLAGPSLREGAVWKPLAERYHPEVGRVILKAVDPAYLEKKRD